MNYKLIHNQHELQKFIDFLPELKENEGYFLILIARAKFAKNVIIPSAVKLRRETVNSKDKILQTIKHWEVEEGTYTVTRNNVVTSIPLENIAVYVSYNPKNHLKAAANMAKACIEILAGSRADVNLKSLANDQIQNSNGSKNYVDIDVDVDKTEDYEEIIKFIKNIIGNEAGTFIKTRGGFHCLIKLDMMKGNQIWYNQIKAHPFKSCLDLFNNELIPIPGTNQGPFVPYMIQK